jgi:hypothetical protein
MQGAICRTYGRIDHLDCHRLVIEEQNGDGRFVLVSGFEANLTADLRWERFRLCECPKVSVNTKLLANGILTMRVNGLDGQRFFVFDVSMGAQPTVTTAAWSSCLNRLELAPTDVRALHDELEQGHRDIRHSAIIRD